MKDRHRKGDEKKVWKLTEECKELDGNNIRVMLEKEEMIERKKGSVGRV